METENDFDMSWIEENEKLHTMQTNYSREHMKHINTFFIYINRDKSVEKIIREKLPLVHHGNRNCSLLSKENVLGIIQTKKIYTPVSKYKFEDIMLYHIDIEPENIQCFTNSEKTVVNSVQYLKVLPFIGDVEIPASIFIFHEINALFFMFKEYELHKPNHTTTLKSILKQSYQENNEETANPDAANNDDNINNTISNPPTRIKHTKKVRIQTNIGEEHLVKNKYRKTRKIKMIMKHMPIIDNTAI